MLLRVIIFSVILNEKYLRNVPVSSSCVQDCALAEKPFGCRIKQYLLMQKRLLQLIKLPKRRKKKKKKTRAVELRRPFVFLKLSENI